MSLLEKELDRNRTSQSERQFMKLIVFLFKYKGIIILYVMPAVAFGERFAGEPNQSERQRTVVNLIKE